MDKTEILATADAAPQENWQMTDHQIIEVCAAHGLGPVLGLHVGRAIEAAVLRLILDALEEREALLLSALNAMLTHMGMDEDAWNKPTFDQARMAIAAASASAAPAEPVPLVEYQALRDVYEAARQVLRYYGADVVRTSVAINRMDAAIEVVKQFDAGYEVESAAQEQDQAQLVEALEEIASMTYDSWTNGARAGEIARAVLKKDKDG